MENRLTPAPGHDWARTRDILISIICMGVILYTVGLILRNVVDTVLIFIVASFLAFALVPSVNGLASRGIPRWLAMFIVYIGLLLALLLGGYWIGGQLVDQLSKLTQQVPQYVQSLQGFVKTLDADLSRRGFNINLQSQIAGLTSGLQSGITGAVGQSLKIVTGLTTAIINVVLVVFFSIYLVADSGSIRANAPKMFPRRYHRLVRFIELTVSDKVGGFIRGQVIMAIIIGLTTGIIAVILRLDFAYVLGVLAFFFELIPTIGPILIGISLAIVAVFQSVTKLVEVTIFYVILHTVESNVLGPRIVGQAVGLPPFASLIAIIAGAEAGGILGALFAVPATALAVTIVRAAVEEWRGVPPADARAHALNAGKDEGDQHDDHHDDAPPEAECPAAGALRG